MHATTAELIEMFSIEELDDIKLAAQERGVSVTTLIREAVLLDLFR